MKDRRWKHARTDCLQPSKRTRSNVMSEVRTEGRAECERKPWKETGAMKKWVSENVTERRDGSWAKSMILKGKPFMGKTEVVVVLTGTKYVLFERRKEVFK